MRRITTIVWALAALVCTASSADAYPWQYRWHTIETEHFRVHYHEEVEATARRAAVLAEEIYPRLAAQFGFEPRFRTQLLVTDDEDRANGSYNFTPANTVHVYCAKPREMGVLDHYGDWLRLLLTHELTHLFHMESVRGLPKGLRYVFGRIVPVNSLHPIFMSEGVAVYNETLLTDFGRGRSTDVDMLLRMAILQDRFEPIDRWTTLSYTGWPSGYLAYNFGGRLHLWTAEKYGHRFGEVSRLHSGEIFPWLYNADMLRVFGKSWYDLYREFEADLRAAYASVEEEVEARGATPFERITETGYRTWKPRFSPDGFFLAWIERTPHDFPRIVRMDVKTGAKKTIVEDESILDFDWSPLGRQIVYTRNYTYRVDTERDDLFLYDTLSGKTRRLTKGARLSEASFAPDRSRLVAVYTHEGATDLVFVRLPSLEIEQLTDNVSHGPQYSVPRFAPDGKKIVLSVRKDGNRDIYLFDPATRAFERLTHHPGIDRSPCFSADGKTLYFSSDRAGISNIYALDFETGYLYRVTNVIGGAFTPSVSPDGSLLAYTGYSADGYDVHLSKIERAAWERVPYREVLVTEATDEGLDEENETKPEPSFHTRRYRPGATILPRWWLPDISFSAGEVLAGIVTGGEDAVREHEWDASVLFWTETFFVGGSLSYTNRQTYPHFTIGGSYSRAYLGRIAEDSDGDEVRYFEKQATGRFNVFFPITFELGISASYRIQDRHNITRILDAQDDPPDVGLFSGVGLNANFDNTRRFGYSIAPERGGEYALSLDIDHSALGSDYDVGALAGSLSQYFGIPKIHHVFQLRLAGAMAEGDRLRQRAFSLGGINGLFLLNSPPDGQYLLRGFPSSAFRGQRVAVAGLSYLFPIWRIERGIGTLPIWFDVLSAHVFGETGSAWDGMWDDGDALHTGVGADVRLSMRFSFRFPIAIRGGAAYGFDEDGVIGWFVSFSSDFW